MINNIKTFLASLPTGPGIYQMLGKNHQILYIGKARNLKKRITSYFRVKASDRKTQSLMKQVQTIEVTLTRTENEALLLECNLIKKHQPRYNILFRDDKSYPYIFISAEHPFPRIDLHRGQKKAKGQYFGPYPHSTAVRETIHLIQKLFLLRGCKDSFFASRTRPCLQFQIARCSGPCAEKLSAEDYQHNVQHAILFLQGKSQQIIEDLTDKMEKASTGLHYELAAHYRNQIRMLREIQEKQYITRLQGNVDSIGVAISAGMMCIHVLTIREGSMLGSRAYFPRTMVEATPEEMITSFITQHYLSRPQDIPKEIIIGVSLTEKKLLETLLTETAHHKVIITHRVRGDRKKWLEMATHSAHQSVTTRLIHETHMRQRFAALQKTLQLKKLPERIECFDISHSQGEATVASCVVFNREGPSKKDYRKFNIQGITPGNDIAAMKQVLLRRFKHVQEDHVLPDILLIDGGKPQLHAAQTILDELSIKKVLLIAIAKGIGRKPGLETLHFVDRLPLHLPPDALALHLLQHIRDEAHRFAISGHRLKRDKKRHTSMLESIPGVGRARRRELLRYFGGIQGLTHASLDELRRVPGISQSLAERIFESLQEMSR